jgi:UDP-N-acetylmuramate--alanine ligase
VAVHIGQTTEAIAAVHAKQPIDWLVYSSAVAISHDQHPEIAFAKSHHIKHTKRDDLLNEIIKAKHLKMVAVAGTHGKSTTTAMLVWLFHDAHLPVSYSVGAKIPFGPMGQYLPDTDYFIYECDEFDRNFLAYNPHYSLITGISWDHHEIFPTQADYNQAFLQFIHQSDETLMWQGEAEDLQLKPAPQLHMLNKNDAQVDRITLPGHENRQDGWQAVQAMHQLTKLPVDQLIDSMNRFPGLKQRMERLAPSLYSNYAHTPEKIKGGMHAALDIAQASKQELVVIYEPLTNRRQHHIKKLYKDSFAGAVKLYWLRSYLAREDPELPVLTPAELILYLDDPSIAEPAEMNDQLLTAIHDHLKAGRMVVAMGASGAGSLDEWLRDNLHKLKV